MNPAGILGVALLLGAANVMAADDWSPLPRPADWPFTVTTAPCPFWASPSCDHDYYVQCKDRPIMTGDPSKGMVWQLEQLQRWLPGGVVAADIFADVKKAAAPGPFGGYMEAAHGVPGSRICPLLDIVQPSTETPEKKEESTYKLWKLLLEKYGSDPCWFNVGGIPVITDYACGGLGPEGVARVSKRLTADGFKFYWISDAIGGLLFALDGKNDKERIEKAMLCTSGVLQFGPPVNHSLGGWAEQRKIFDSLPSPRVLGFGVSSGSYSARGNQRNYVSARGTELLRRDLELMVLLKGDAVNTQTWNDYVESAHFEPSYKHTSSLLEIVRYYAEERVGAQHPADSQPHLYISYRKNIFAGEPLEIELLNLPVAKPFGELDAAIILRDSSGKELSRLPVKLDGGKAEAKVVSWPVPSGIVREMLDVQVELSGAFSKRYLNLPPIPVVSDGRYADPLTFTVPLHRLFTAAPLRLAINGASADIAALMPRLLSVSASGAPATDGVSYLKSGSIINDPSPFSREPVMENYPDDGLRNCALPAEYYGALSQFADGSIAYSNGLWCDVPGQARVHADYWFKDFVPWSSGYGEEWKGKLWDRGGRKYHGTLKSNVPNGALPEWVGVGYFHKALRFDGKGAVVDLPGAMGFPIGPATVELMLKPEAVGKAQAILCEGGELINVYLEADGKIRLRHCNSRRLYDDLVGNTALTPGKWTYVAGTYDMTKMRLYVDGKLDGEIATDGIRPNEGARIGYRFWGGVDPRQGDWGYYQGLLAHLRLLQGASKPEEIAHDAKELLDVYGAAEKGSLVH